MPSKKISSISFKPVCNENTCLWVMSRITHMCILSSGYPVFHHHMMTLWHDNDFRITGSLWRESTVAQLVPFLTNDRQWTAFVFSSLLVCTWWTNNPIAGDLNRHAADVTSVQWITVNTYYINIHENWCIGTKPIPWPGNTFWLNFGSDGA